MKSRCINLDAARTSVPRTAEPTIVPVQVNGPPTARTRKLSRRELEVARYLVEGFTNLNIASRTDLSENTVRTYVRRLYRKLDVSNRVELVRKLFTTGFPESISAPG